MAREKRLLIYGIADTTHEREREQSSTTMMMPGTAVDGNGNVFYLKVCLSVEIGSTRKRNRMRNVAAAAKVDAAAEEEEEKGAVFFFFFIILLSSPSRRCPCHISFRG